MRLKFLILFTSILLPAISAAQAKIVLKDIKKIQLSEYEDGVAGFMFSRQYEIIHKDGKWLCWQMQQDYQPPHYIKRDEHIRAFRIQHAFIGQVNVLAVTELLKSIAVIKPLYNWKMYPCNPDSLKNGMNSYYRFRGEGYLKPEKLKAILAMYHNNKNLSAAVDSVQRISPVDAVTGCFINIIGKNNDTIKIETEHMRPYMQPWKINGTETYDLNINRFFVSVMTHNSISNKDFLTGKDFYDDVINEVEIQYIDQHPSK